MSDPADLPALAAEDATTFRLDTDALASPAADAKTIATAAPAQVSLNLERTGDFIGRYRLITELGEGGFGVVWRAEQNEPIHREVALKVIKPGMDSREIIARFEAERQALALMDHPNIAGVLDAGTTDSGRPFFVMELVKGVPITDYCDAHQLTIRQRLELFIPVCQAVQHAHQKAILHRDLKPSNILVTEVDDKPVPKVIDFGIAKALHATSEPALHATLAQTLAGMIVGTPQYMSPEQAGSMPDVDTRSDIYTLGVILYELLVGDTPLSREQMKKAALDEVLRLVRESEPRRPSSKFTPATELAKTTATLRHTDSKKLGHALRGDLDWVMLKALEKDRVRRYDTANDFAMDLRRHLNDEPVSAGPPSAGYRLKKLVQRNRLVFSAAAAILTMLIAGIAVSTWQAVRATKAEKLAEAAAIHARKTLSQSDFLQSLRSIDEEKRSDALAQLARSIATNPKNEAALWRLATLLAYHSFALPVSRLRHDVNNVAESSIVDTAQFSSDGKRIVTAVNGVARIWDVQSGRLLTTTMQDGDYGIGFAQFSPDGKRVVTASGIGRTQGAAQIWDAQSGKPLATRMEHGDHVRSAQFSPDGLRIVTASWDDSARVWNAKSGSPITSPMKHDGGVSEALFSTDGKWIVTVSNAANRISKGPNGKVIRTEDYRDANLIVRTWDAQSGKPISTPMKHEERVRTVEFSPARKRIVIVSGKIVRVWDAESGQPLTPPMKHDASVWSARFSPDGKEITTRSQDNTTRVWNAENGEPLTEPKENEGWAESARFSPDGKLVMTGAGTETSTVRVWNAQAGNVLPEPMKQDSSAVAAQFAKEDSTRFSRDGKYVVTIVDDKAARAWDAHSGQPVAPPMKHDDKVLFTGFSADGKRVVTGSGKAARVWDAQDGRALTPPMVHEDSVSTAEFSSDGKLISTTSGRTARVWDVTTGKPVTGVIQIGAGIWSEANSAQFSPDGHEVLLVGNSAAYLLDAKTGHQLGEPLQHNRRVLSAEFSPDGKRIVTGSRDNTARIWDAKTGKMQTDPLKHDAYVWSAHFSPDSKRVVTIAGIMQRPGVEVRDQWAQVWDAQSGQPLIKLKGEWVESAEFTADGRSVLTDGRTWNLAPLGEMPEWLPRLAEAVAGQRLNESGVFEPLKEDPGRVLAGIREQLDHAPEDNDWTIWGRWFLADRSTRTISPFSKITIPEYIERRIIEKTPDSLDEAERLAVGNAELLQRIEHTKEATAKQVPPSAPNQESPAASTKVTIEVKEAALALHRKKNGPEHPDTLRAMTDLALSYEDNGRRDEALKLGEELLTLSRKVNGPENPDTLDVMHALAETYADEGRWDEAFALWSDASVHTPKDTALALKIAALQAWFGKDADHAATSRLMIGLAAGADDASTAERAAKAYCLRPSSDPQLVESAVTLARHAVELGKGHQFLEWYQMALGMAEYRHGNFPVADQALGAAEHDKGDPLVRDTARLFHAMSLFRQGKQSEAREIFDKAVAQMKPLPADENLPLANGTDADSVIVWLAYKEAKVLLELTKPGAK